jgi:hypothetical protein
MVGECAFVLGVIAFGSTLLCAAHRVNGGINIDPLNRIESDFRHASAIGPAPNLSSQPMSNAFKLADLPFRDFYKEPPYGGINRQFGPSFLARLPYY